MNGIIYKNLRDVEGLITNTYILAVITAVVFVLLAMLVAQLIAYQGGKKPRDPARRRTWFWILAFVNMTIFFSWNYFYVQNQIKPVKALVNDFLMNSAIATGVSLIVYIILGFLLSRALKNRKFGTVFPKKS